MSDNLEAWEDGFKLLKILNEGAVSQDRLVC